MAIVPGQHGLFGLANVLDLAGGTGHHIDNPGGLAVIGLSDVVLSYSPAAPHHGGNLLHSVTADTAFLCI